MKCWKHQVLEVLKDIRELLIADVRIAEDSNKVLHQINDRFSFATKIIFKASGKVIESMNMNVNQRVTLTAQPINDSVSPEVPGNIDAGAIIAWSVDNLSLVTIVPAADGLTAVVTSLSPGTVNVRAFAPANGNTIEGFLPTIIGGSPANFATKIVITAGTPTDVTPGP